MIEIYFDGLTEPTNPGGITTYGFVVYVDGRLKKAGNGYIGEGRGMTNNVAEYMGLIRALEYVLQQLEEGKLVIGNNDEVKIFGDSQLIINQVNGEWKIKSKTSITYAPQARDLFRQVPGRKSLQWIPREENEAADLESRKAYYAATIQPIPERKKAFHRQHQIKTDLQATLDTFT